MIRWLKRYLYNKLFIRSRDILFGFVLLSVFYLFKGTILNTYLKFSIRPYNRAYISLQKRNIETELLIKENAHLREIMNLPERLHKRTVFGQVLTNVYASSCFWVLFRDTKNIQKGAVVWSQEPSIKGYTQTHTQSDQPLIRLIGFVEEVRKNHVKVKPISHSSSRFDAKTISGDGLLLIGNNGKLDILLSNNPTLQQGQLVVFQNWLQVGLVSGKSIKFIDFSRVQWVGVII